MKNIIIKILCWFILFSYMTGCTTTEIVQYKAELNNPDKTGTLTVLTKDSTEYVLENYRLMDTLLVGNGSVTAKNSTVKNFSGNININDVIKIEGEKTSIERTLLGLGIFGLFLIAYLNSASVNDNGNTLTVTYVSPYGGGGGCK